MARTTDPFVSPFERRHPQKRPFLSSRIDNVAELEKIRISGCQAASNAEEEIEESLGILAKSRLEIAWSFI